MIPLPLTAARRAQRRAVRAHAAEWTRATTAREVGDLTARWLTGDLPYSPAYGGPGAPDHETISSPGLLGACVALCRAGVVTIGSQPGATSPDGPRVWQQRAYVEALADADAVAIVRRVLVADLGGQAHAVALPIRARRADPATPAPITPVTVTGPDRQAVTSLGGWHPTTRAVARVYGHCLTGAALAAVAGPGRYYLAVHAAEWGDDDGGLWRALAAAAVEVERA